MRDGHTVTGYFYNPNIHPQDEYKKRLESAGKAADNAGFEIVEGPYDRERWFELIKGKEYEPEGGSRCETCFRMRLEKTYDCMKKKMFDAFTPLQGPKSDVTGFTTTLTVSPHKDATLINTIGRDIGDEKFICADFKKKGGFARATEAAKELGLYRQNYCGCIYSLEEMHRRAGVRDKG